MFGCNTGVGAPVMYNYINQYNSSISPSTNHCKILNYSGIFRGIYCRKLYL